MSIPSFTLDGILPPFTGSDPAQPANHMSPYVVTATEVVSHFATSDERKEILAGWLRYRQALRNVGITRGFQWLDGSFLEDKESLGGGPPNDIDLLVYYHRPGHITSPNDWDNFKGYGLDNVVAQHCSRR